MKKQILSIIIFCTTITLQIHSMEIVKSNNDKESTCDKLLTALDTSARSRETIESPTKYHNNYVPSLPATISSTYQKCSNLKKEKINELDEVITFHDTTKNNIEEISSQKHHTTKEKINTELATENINTNLDNENKSGRCLIITAATSVTILISGMMAGLTWLIADPEFWSCYNRTHLPACQLTPYSFFK